MPNVKIFTIFELHQIALLSAKGWEPVELYAKDPDVMWRKVGTQKEYSFDYAYWMEADEGPISNTIPSPPHPDVEKEMGEEICDGNHRGGPCDDSGCWRITHPSPNLKELARSLIRYAASPDPSFNDTEVTDIIVAMEQCIENE